jgi:hypothetical protein
MSNPASRLYVLYIRISFLSDTVPQHSPQVENYSGHMHYHVSPCFLTTITAKKKSCQHGAFSCVLNFAMLLWQKHTYLATEGTMNLFLI